MSDAIRFEKVTKTFGKVVANKDVSFSVEKGKIYAILGENGSGKTTLMNVIAGIYKQDGGKVYINEKEAHINSPLDAFRYNVGMIHQHFKLVDVFTAVENVAQGLKEADVPEYKVLQEEYKELGNRRELKKKIKKLEKEITQQEAEKNTLSEKLCDSEFLKKSTLVSQTIIEFKKLEQLLEKNYASLEEISGKIDSIK